MSLNLFSIHNRLVNTVLLQLRNKKQEYKKYFNNPGEQHQVVTHTLLSLSRVSVLVLVLRSNSWQGLICRDEQDETISALFEIGVGLVGFGFYGDALRFTPHVKLHGRAANLHGEVDFSYTETKTKTNLSIPNKHKEHIHIGIKTLLCIECTDRSCSNRASTSYLFAFK